MPRCIHAARRRVKATRRLEIEQERICMREVARGINVLLAGSSPMRLLAPTESSRGLDR